MDGKPVYYITVASSHVTCMYSVRSLPIIAETLDGIFLRWALGWDYV